ncbi:MAG: OmpA family protein [Acidobacteria bacterium]|nr:OmpA family protein [Acidobacteriota bacterium]
MTERFTRSEIWRVAVLGCVLAAGMLASGPVFGASAPAETRAVPAGENVEMKGVIVSRDGETLVLRDSTRTDTVLLLTDTTTIKTKASGDKPGEKFDVTALVPGLIVTAKGTGDAEGRLVVRGIRFKKSDYKAAVTAYTMTDPVADKADQALRDIASTDQRIAALDDYDLVKTVTVYFAVNKADLSPEAKASLDEAAASAPGARNYTVEVQGFTDSTGDFDKNLELSQRRANAVVQYLAVKHDIPLRRIVTPMGYGSTKAVADESTAEGRAQNRRVEVRVLVNKGLGQGSAGGAK